MVGTGPASYVVCGSSCEGSLPEAWGGSGFSVRRGQLLCGESQGSVFGTDVKVPLCGGLHGSPTHLARGLLLGLLLRGVSGISPAPPFCRAGDSPGQVS